MPPIRVTFSIPTGEEKSYTVPYKPLTPTVVTQNFTLDDDKTKRKRLGNRHVSINTVPTMLIPRVRVREDKDFMDLSDLVIPDDDLKAIHLAALYPSILNHQSKTREDSVTGRQLVGKRVTFSDIICVCGSDSETESIWSISSSGFGSCCSSPPEYLESFGSTLPDITVTPTRLSSASLGSDDHQQCGRRCSSCHELEDTRHRVVKYFGGVNQFLTWIYSKWGKGTGVDSYSKDNFLLRGYAPHFCSFTQKVHLHDRPVSSTPREVWVDWDNDNDNDNGNSKDNDNDSHFDTASRRSVSVVSGIDGRTTPSTTGPTIVDNDLTGTDRNTGDNKQTIGVVITPGKSDSNKGIIRFGFPVSKPAHSLSNKTLKSKKPANKVHGNKKIIKDDNNKKNKVQTSSKKKKEKENDAIELLNKIISSSAKDDDTKPEDNNDDHDTVKTPRSPVTKKEKKEKEPPTPPPPVKEREVTPEPKTRKLSPSPVTEPEIRSEAPEVPLPVLPETPDLPKLRTPEPPKEPKPQSKQRSAISSSKSQKNKQETDSDTRFRPEFDINAAMEIPATESSSKSKIHQWLHGRLALSQQSSRFELPMDMKNLETMSPLEYLRRHCVISNRRQNLYQKIFLKNKDKSGLILLKDLEKGLNDVLVNGINSEQLEEFSRLLLIPDDVKIDCRLFSCIAAVVERLLYPKFLTADTADLPEFQKEKIECADFCALDWKFHGVKVNPPTERLIKSIQAVG